MTVSDPSAKEINRKGYDGFTIDIQVWKDFGINKWAQAHYLVHGIDDVLWTNSIEEVIIYIKSDLERLENVRITQRPSQTHSLS